MKIGAEEIRKWHTDPPRNWSDIGYHYVIRRDGSVEKGRPINIAGAHAKGHNSHSIGICMVGGKARLGKQAFNFSIVQMNALSHLVNNLQKEFHLIPSDVIGHNEVSAKDCPCFDVRAWIGV